ncbi:unnamed protein product [Cuscuta campestris]|uniref:Filament-like plant protein 7 n=1 Tax=Cuscuta campestris TaxID=132261 RepID=A0A484KJT8_9ASTE|nr:unnamed protein product [Cuscuta campestris]
MEHKQPWIWKKKSAESGRRPSFSRNEEDLHVLLKGKAELERDIQKLNDRLSSALLECNAKDDFSQRQAKIAREAIAGWEKAETEAIFLKQELEKALYQIAASDERLVSLDSALNECMHQLRSVRGEQEKTRVVFEEKLAKLVAENTQLNKALMGKEKVIVNLSAQRAMSERELNTLMTRLDSLETELGKNEKQSRTPFSKKIGASDMNLMDDFVEMEKLAVERAHKGCILERSASTQEIKSHTCPSITKIIEIIEGILPYRVSETQAGFTVRHFQWKTSELSLILQEFVQTCHNFLYGNADFEKFAEQLACTLEWTVNHCFSLQDVSSMEDAIKNHFEWDDESRSECEVGPPPQFIVVNDGGKIYKGEYANATAENMKEEDLGRELQTKNGEAEPLTVEIQESESTINSLKMEVENLKGLKSMIIEDRDERHKIIKEGLEMQIEATKLKLNEACQKYSLLEKETDRTHEESVPVAHDKLQLCESISDKGISQDDVDNEERLIQNDWEITAASEKLAECQETILNLGKQLKALASPKDAAIFDNSMSTPKKNLGHRSSLLDIMLDEDNDGQCCKSPKTKELILNGNSHSALGAHNKAVEPRPEDVRSPNGNRNIVEDKDHGNTIEEKDSVDSIAIVRGKKKNGGLLKKLLSCKKTISS